MSIGIRQFVVNVFHSIYKYMLLPRKLPQQIYS